MTTIALIFPHQLFSDHPVLREKPEKVLLIEDSLFFGDAAYPARMHKQKLAFHRASMAEYLKLLKRRNVVGELVGYQSAKDGLGVLFKGLAKSGASHGS